uniref:Uncharacterized protein n=1 Tax=Anopheles culicifacies TaxID=139723 RepID=A0A182LWC9_9DIPT
MLCWQGIERDERFTSLVKNKLLRQPFTPCSGRYPVSTYGLNCRCCGISFHSSRSAGGVSIRCTCLSSVVEPLDVVPDESDEPVAGIVSGAIAIGSTVGVGSTVKEKTLPAVRPTDCPQLDYLTHPTNCRRFGSYACKIPLTWDPDFGGFLAVLSTLTFLCHQEYGQWIGVWERQAQ